MSFKEADYTPSKNAKAAKTKKPLVDMQISALARTKLVSMSHAAGMSSEDFLEKMIHQTYKDLGFEIDGVLKIQKKYLKRGK